MDDPEHTSPHTIRFGNSSRVLANRGPKYSPFILQQELSPAYACSAYKNKGVQPLLDAVTAYLPAPEDTCYTALVRHCSLGLTP